MIAALSGTPYVRAKAVGPIDNPVKLGLQVAGELLNRGAGEILDKIRNIS